MLRWMATIIAICTTERHAINRDRILHLATYTGEQLSALRTKTSISFEARQQGTLQVSRFQGELAVYIPVLQSYGLGREVLSGEMMEMHLSVPSCADA